MSNPMIDFEKLQNIIPEKGYINITFRKTPAGEISVLFKSQSNLVKQDSSYDNDVKPKAEMLEEMRKTLDKTIPFKGTPQKLTAEFEVLISGRQTAEKNFVDAINESTEELNAKIKELKDKKAAKTAAAKPAAKPAASTGKPPIKETAAPESAGKDDGQPEGSAAGTLFGEVAEKGKEAA